LAGCQLASDLLQRLLLRFGAEGQGNIDLRLKVLVEGALRHLRPSHDLIHGGLVEALCPEELARSAQYPAASILTTLGLCAHILTIV
jgi:hypothetical protein